MFTRLVFELEHTSQRKIDHDTRFELDAFAVDFCSATPFDGHDNFCKLLLHVRSDAARRLELARQHRTKRGHGASRTQIPHAHRTLAAEKPRAAIVWSSVIPHSAHLTCRECP